MLAFYRGLSASYLGVGETAIQFMLYGYLKDEIVAYEQRSLTLRNATSDQEAVSAAFSGRHALLAGALSKLIASAATYPHEAIRTRMRGNAEAESAIFFHFEQYSQLRERRDFVGSMVA